MLKEDLISCIQESFSLIPMFIMYSERFTLVQNPLILNEDNDCSEDELKESLQDLWSFLNKLNQNNLEDSGFGCFRAVKKRAQILLNKPDIWLYEH